MQHFRDALSGFMAKRIGRSVDIVVASSSKLGDMLRAVGTEVVVSPNTVLDRELTESVLELRSVRAKERGSRKRKMTVICVGNLIYLKRFELAISALTDSSMRDAELVIVGKPAPRKSNYLLRIASELGVLNRVRFAGQLSRQDVLKEMSDASVLFHPSAREGSPGVVAEATALGLPVACFVGTGAAVILEAAEVEGVKIPVTAGLTPRDLAGYLIRAAALDPNPVDKWSHERLVDLEHALIRNARRHRDARD